MPEGTGLLTSGAAVRGLLARGELPPSEVSRPEAARLLAAAYTSPDQQAGGDDSR